MTSLCVTIRKGTKEYTFHGIRHARKSPAFLYIHVQDGELYMVRNAKIIDVMTSVLTIGDKEVQTLERLEKA